MKHTQSQPAHSNRHTDKQQDHHRVAARMEGVVKNLGTKKQKKEPKV
jgi:hypothetical protein